MGGMVTVFDPQGNAGEIPEANLAAAVKAGAMPAVHMRSPDGSDGYVPANRMHEAVQAGGKVLPFEQQEVKSAGFWHALWGDIKSIPESITGTDPLADPRVPDAEKNRIVAQQQAQAAATNQARTQAHGKGYSLASTAGEMIGVPVSGMEQSAAQGDVGGVLGHAATVPAVMAATEGAARGVGAAADIPVSKATVPVRAAARAANTALAKAPGVIGGTVGAAIGHATGIPYAGEIGFGAGNLLGRRLLPQVQIPENIGLPSRVTGGPATAPEYAPPQVAIPGPRTPPAKPATLSDLRGAIDQTLVVQPLAKNVPLRQQASVMGTTVAGAPKLPEGFTPVESSAIKGYKYDPAAQELETVSSSGQRYVHGDVSPEQFAKFEATESKGKAWNAIRQDSTLVAKVINGKRVPIRPTAQRSAPEETPAVGNGLNEGGDLMEQLQQSLAAAKAKKATKGTP